MKTNEANFETIIENILIKGQPEGAGFAETQAVYGAGFAPGGYIKRKNTSYDSALCLDPELLLNFIRTTQPERWQKFKQQHADATTRLPQGVATLIKRKGVLEAMRRGFKQSGCHFRLVYFRPNTTLNPDMQQKYEANIFSIMRQVMYKAGKKLSLDLGLFLNGIPLFSAELKNPLTSQNVFNAITQYKEDRSPKEPLFKQGRCIAHFAVDPQLVYFTTTLAGEKTRFFPFNQGYNLGAGNPPVHPKSSRFATSYLWEETWSRDSVLNLIHKFAQFFDELDDKGQKTGKKLLIFPRYHQLSAVRGLITHARTLGTGHRYLIQHSAGSGKTYTIAWLAHQLATLHAADNERVFDSILVITDRRILDQQLQQAMRDFEQERGVVENIDTTSRQLKEALEDGKQIIVTTLHKFPVIAKQMEMLNGRNFAVIVDEAHSSQSGSMVQELNRTLSSVNDDEAQEDAPDDLEDVITNEVLLRRHLPNVSTFAFTATPKPKTLQLFGSKQGESYEAFSHYPMRQAIEEGFIMDVLENYTTYKSYFHLLKKVQDDPHYDKKKAARLLMRFVNDHPKTIEQKVAIIVEHFHEHVAHRIDGKAKAMIVTRSRPHAVRYKLAVDAYLAQQKLPYQTLVAFSGKINDPETALSHTESSLNSQTAGEQIGEKQTAEAFKQARFRFLIVANKFQTGFDQPLLHTMYVDKQLGGVNAVQTLSRLNRTHAKKSDTAVVDFVNDVEEIEKAFNRYYEKTILSKATDPNVLYAVQGELEDFHFYSEDEVASFAKVFYQGDDSQMGMLYNILAPVVAKFSEAGEDEQVAFRSRLRDFVRLYAFLSQVLPFVETEWEKLFHFGRLLLTVLPIYKRELPSEIKQQVDMETYSLKQTFEGSIGLKRGENKLAPVGMGNAAGVVVPEMEPLSQILHELNQLGGVEVTPDNEAAVRQLQTKLKQDDGLEAALRVNSEENARLAFDEFAEDQFQEMIDDNFKFYKHVTDDVTLKRRFFDWLFEQYLRE